MADDHPSEDVDAAVAAARTRFETEFAEGCDRISGLLDRIAAMHDTDAVQAIAHILHRMGGLGGTIGYPHVSAHARDMEDWVRDRSSAAIDIDQARARLRALRQAFAEDSE